LNATKPSRDAGTEFPRSYDKNNKSETSENIYEQYIHVALISSLFIFEIHRKRGVSRSGRAASGGAAERHSQFVRVHADFDLKIKIRMNSDKLRMALGGSSA